MAKAGYREAIKRVKEYVDTLPLEMVKEQPEHSIIETIYICGKNPHWSVGDILAYYEFTSDCEGEIVLGKITKVELDEEYDDWLYTFEDGFQYDEESLLNDETYKKNQKG